LGAKGVRVNSVQPGYIETNLTRGVANDRMTELRDRMRTLDLAKQPLKERELNVNDIAKVTAFLASDAAGCITGEHIAVDGGRSFGGGLDIASLGL
jgi:3-oxoacyl-[acyl-carrier protein] reductase